MKKTILILASFFFFATLNAQQKKSHNETARPSVQKVQTVQKPVKKHKNGTLRKPNTTDKNYDSMRIFIESRKDSARKHTKRKSIKIKEKKVYNRNK